MFRRRRPTDAYFQTDEGEVLRVRTGVIEDERGKPLVDPEDPFFGRYPRLKRFLFKGGLPLTILGAFAIPGILFVGFAAFAVLGGFGALAILAALVGTRFGPDRPASRPR